jgi:crotonobetaine/carnitine-CoA ligase
MTVHHIPLEDRVFGKFILTQVEKNAGRTYLSYQQHQWTYEAFLQESQSLARGLKELGVGHQQRVILLMNNRPEFMVVYWALTFLNAIVVPVNTALKGDSLAYLFKDTGASVILADADLLPNLVELGAGRMAELHTLVVVGDAENDTVRVPVKRVLSYKELMGMGCGGATICEPAHFDDIHLIPYTSGTTGPSKGVIVPYAQSFQTAMSCIEAAGIEKDDIIYTPLPFFHGMSRSMGALPALLLGAHVHIAPRFSGSRFWQEVAAVKATVAVTVFSIPPILKALPPSELDRRHDLRVMFNAHHDAEFEMRFGVRIVEAHGMTEVGLSVYSPYPERQEGSAGRAGADWEVRVVDELGRPLPPGNTGEMVVRPRLPSIMMKGYLNKPAETLASMQNLWFYTGDFMRMDQDGFLYFDGRKKERIRCRGENVSAYEIEMVVMQHPEVAECAVVAHPAGDGEDEVRLVASRVVNAALTETQLAEWLDTRLAKFMLPRYVEFRDQLPKTASGKIEKLSIVETSLPEVYWDRRLAVMVIAAVPAVGEGERT